MKKMICVIAGELSPRNEQHLNGYDDDTMRIELFKDGIAGGNGIAVGTILRLWEMVQETPDDAICFCTDMKRLYDLVKRFYADVFCETILLPETNSERIERYEAYLELMQETDLSFFPAIRKSVCSLETYFSCMGEKLDFEAVSVYTREKWLNVMKEFNENQRRLFWMWLEEYIEVLGGGGHLFRFYCLSLLLGEQKKRSYIEALYEEVHADCYGVEQWFWLFHQIKRFCLENDAVSGMDIAQKLYDEALQIWRGACEGLLEPIPKEERKKNRVAVIVLQFIGTRHAPTKTAFERIGTLKREMDRELVVVHSAEQLTTRGRLPFWNAAIGSIDHGLDGMNSILGNDGLTFPMYQPKAAMPDYQEIRAIIEMLRDYKPYEIIVLGNYCLLGDLVAQMIPTICISMTFSVIPLKQHQFVAVGKHLTESDFRYIEENHCDQERYIESVFTFRPTVQTTTLSREALGLPKDRFLLSVVGIRLDSEVTEQFLNEVKEVFGHGCHIVFAGDFARYDSLCEKLPILKEYSTYVGYQNDILAFQEVCDLYVNPPRVGGGFSVVEAFCKGKPAVTLPYGDVAASSGPEFWVTDLREMVDTIIRYKEDTEFYRMKSEKALARSRELFDGRGALEHIIGQAERSGKFF